MIDGYGAINEMRICRGNRTVMRKYFRGYTLLIWYDNSRSLMYRTELNTLTDDKILSVNKRYEIHSVFSDPLLSSYTNKEFKPKGISDIELPPMR
jgi:hypothetical protein